MKNILLILLPLIALLSIFLYPNATFALSGAALFASLAITTYSIFQKHKATEKAWIKITKDTLTFVITFLLITFLGGLAGLFTNFYVSNLFGAAAGFVCAMLAGVGIGYVVRKGTAKVFG